MGSIGPRILIVEDEFLIAAELGRLAAGCGCTVVGPVGTVDEALALIGDGLLDGAILDIALGREFVWPVAEALADRAVPFVFATGYSQPPLPERFQGVRILAKPLRSEAVADALRRQCGRPGQAIPAGAVQAA